ncbi:MAG: hypothetical protein ACPG5B_16295 [Chitinophagales bacterium]
MMRFDRGNCPECLWYKDKNNKHNYQKWNQKWKSTHKKNPVASFNWPQEINLKIIQDLRIMSKHHCAFCDKYMGAADSDSIEHFWPKKIFPEFAFSWENLFLSCGGCQKAPKGWKKFQNDWIEAEKSPLILKPDMCDFSFQRYFFFDTNSGEIKVNLWNDSKMEQEQAEITIFYYKFNGFKRAHQRQVDFQRYSDVTQSNNLKEDYSIDELSYRFMYL